MKVIYCAYGRAKYAAQLEQSVRSLRLHHPDAQITMYTTAAFAGLLAGLPVQVVVLDTTAQASDWHDPFMKLRAIHAAACVGQAFLYLDNDTYVAGSLSDAWQLLDRFDCMGVHSPIPDQRGFLSLPPAHNTPNPAIFPEWNGGVLFFSGRPAAQAIAADWLNILEQRIPGGGDQWPLGRALWQSGARLHVLPNTYNCRLPACPLVYGAVKILHDDHPELAGVAQVVNADPGYRQIIRHGDAYALSPDPSQGRRCF
jgi:hypothetical protein